MEPQQAPSSRIKSTKVEPPRGVSFSYRYFQDSNNKFSISNKDARYLEAFIQRLRDLSTMTVNEISVTNAKSLRCHPIDWNQTSEPCFDLPNEEQLVDTPYQFQLSSNEHGRVHGFFIENVFYIVWLDPDHKLYS
ncbi:MAG: hypothetical protein V7K89_15565 [Nostoc sp.]|uniref:hypothetical protein n=1 Tax=Nostoc sp. TaxID=1180 RepID=UPI002FF5FEEB